MLKDFEHRYRVVRGRDARFDGLFYVAVTSTGIYCRPSCPAVTPRRSNVRLSTAAAAQYAGFRACKRCRPDAVPGSPDWDVRTDLVARAMRLIADGVVDRDGVSGLARRLGYTERHLNRLLATEVGAGPLALARARRAHNARLLIETTDLSITDVAFAAGFTSVRQFNDTIREVFAATPRELRRARGNKEEGVLGGISLRLPYREPFDAEGMLQFLGTRAVTGVEHFDGAMYRRTLRLPTAPEPWRSPKAGIISSACFIWRISETSVARYSGAAGSSTSTLTPPPSSTYSGTMRCSARSSVVRPGGACREAWTAPNSLFAPCWDSRSPWPGPAPWQAASSPAAEEPFQNRLPGTGLRICSPARATWPVLPSMASASRRPVVRCCVASRSPGSR